MSAVKDKAKHLLSKLFESTNESNPPNQHTSTDTSHDHLVQSFHNLNPFTSTASNLNEFHSSPDFIGGFHPSPYHTYGSNDSSIPPYSTPGPLPRPPVMPTPSTGQHSLTMQYALQPPHSFPTSARPVSAPIPSIPLSNFKPPSEHDLASSAHVRPKPTPTKVEGSNISSASTQDPDQIQCAGVTKAGKRCQRKVKGGPSLSQGVFGENDGEPIERFCFQHTKELLSPSGYYARKNGEWIKFEDWIPDYLEQDTQVALRVEMEKARSQSDVPGYIYTFEIRDPKVQSTIKLKVGRATNLVKRIDQWGKQCGSKEQVLRGWYPGSVIQEEDGEQGSLMKGRVQAGKQGAWCHRLERLIHLELADLVFTGVYLNPIWPNTSNSSAATSTSPNSPVKRGKADGARKEVPCADCGAMHKEIFEFKRIERGRLKGKEWEAVVKPVIEKWGKFVDEFV